MSIHIYSCVYAFTCYVCCLCIVYKTFEYKYGTYINRLTFKNIFIYLGFVYLLYTRSVAARVCF